MRRHVFFLSAALLIVPAAPARADDLSTIKTRAFQYHALTGPGVDFTDSNVKAAATSLVAAAQKNANTWIPTSKTCGDGSVRQGSWSDIDYCDVGVSATWQPITHFTRLLQMAQAYRIPLPGSALYNNATLKMQIEQALTVVPTFYNAPLCYTQVTQIKSPNNMNWYFCEIGAPLLFAPALLLVENAVDATVFANARAVMEGSLCPDMDWKNGPFVCNKNGIPLTAQNLLDVANARLYDALYPPAGTSGQTRLVSVATSVAQASALGIGGDDGIQPDSSFHQHHQELETGSYGAGFVTDISRFLYFTGGTPYGLDATSLRHVIDFLDIGTRWSVYGNCYDISVLSRSVTRPNQRASAATLGMMWMALTPSTAQADFQATAKAGLTAWIAAKHGFSVEDAQQVAPVLALAQPAAWPSGHRHFPNSDHTIHRRPNYYASIKMFSTRMKSGELVTNEDKLGSRQSDGRLHLTLTGNEYLDAANAPPAMDWTRLPGITVAQQPGAADATYGFGTRAFAGGTGDGQNGVSAMDLEALNPAGTAMTAPKLTAKKSWFFFEDAIVFLTADIKYAGTHPVETIVEQWPLSAAGVPIAIADGTTNSQVPWTATLPNVQWLAADGLGYWFPGGQSINVKRAVQTGDWSSIGVATGVVSKPFLTLYYDHGMAPSAASAAYAIVPNADGARMASFANAPPVTIVANSSTVAAVAHNAGGTSALGVVRWSAGGAPIVHDRISVTSDQPVVAYLEDTGATLSVSAADPAQAGGMVTLTLAGAFVVMAKDAQVTVTPGAMTTTVTLPRDGFTYAATLAWPAPADAGAPPDAGMIAADAAMQQSDAALQIDSAATQSDAPSQPDDAVAIDLAAAPDQSPAPDTSAPAMDLAAALADAASADAGVASDDAAAGDASAASPKGTSGCGCRVASPAGAGDPASSLAILLVVGVAAARARRRRSIRM